MTLIWPFKVIKGQTDYTIRFASYELLYVFYSNHCAISHRNQVFQQITLIWPSKITKGQTDYTIRFASYELLCVFYSNYSAILHRNPVFIRWPWSDLSRSRKVKLVAPSDSHHMSCYVCPIVTIALSRTETLFFMRLPWFDLQRLPKVKLITASDKHHMISYTCSIITIALSRTEKPCFSSDDLDLTFQGQQRSNWLHHPIRIIWVAMCVL